MTELACRFCGAPGPHAVVATLAYSAGDLPLYACTACGTRFFPAVDAMLHVLDWESGLAVRSNLELGEALAAAAGLLATLPLPPGSRALHLGSGLGVAVDMAVRVCGWKAYGFETGGRAETAIRLFGETRLFNEEISDDTLPEGMFDVILATHVLERQGRPRAFLTALRARLKEGGMLLLDATDGAPLTAGLDAAALAHRTGPGMNYVLPTALALLAALRETGFTDLRVETTVPWLRVLARLNAPLPAPRPEATLRRDYASAVLESAVAGSALWNGAAYLALVEHAAAGDLAAAYAVYARLSAAWKTSFGLDMGDAETLAGPVEQVLADAPPAAFAAPLCLGPVLLARTHLALATPDATSVQVLRWQRAAYRAAVSAQRFLRFYTLQNGGLAQTILFARQGIAAQLVRLAPSLAPDLAAGLSRPSRTALDAVLCPEASFPASHAARHFIDAVAGQRPAEALRWAHALPADIPGTLAPWPVLVADVLYCLGVLALTAQADPAEAQNWFMRMAAFCAAHPALSARLDQALHHTAMATSATPPRTSRDCAATVVDCTLGHG